MAEIKNPNTLSWAAIVISVIALVFGFVAYNRADNLAENSTAPINNQNRIENQADPSEGVRDEIRRQLAVAEARARLMVLKVRVETGLSASDAQKEIASIRQDLADSFRGEQGEVKTGWQKMDDELSRLEQLLRSGSTDALRTLEKAIGELRKGVE